MLGFSNVAVITTELLREKYNSWAELAEVVVIEEMMAYGRMDIANKLKPLITENHISIRKMHTNAYPVRNRTNILAFTNHQNSMVLGDTDRRWWAWYSDAAPKGRDYYIALFKWTEDNLATIYGWAVRRVNNVAFDPEINPPTTQAKTQMVLESTRPITAFLSEAMESHSWPCHNDLLVIKDLQFALNRYGYREFGKMHANTLARELAALGAQQYADSGGKPATVRMRNGERFRVWVLRDYDKYQAMVPTEIRDNYERPGDPEMVRGTSI